MQVDSATGGPLVDAVVYAVPTTPAAPTPLPKTVIDQIHRRFLPRVSVVRVGTTVRFPNSDNIRHSVYSFSSTKVFQLELYAGEAASPVKFDKPGLVVLGCNIHDSMVGWLLVVDTPFFARTDKDGHALLSKLPPGDYRLHIWHEPLLQEPPEQTLHVTDARAPQNVTVRLDLSAAVAPGVSMPGMAMPPATTSAPAP